MGSDKRNDGQKTMRDGNLDRDVQKGVQPGRDQQDSRQQMSGRDDDRRFEGRQQDDQQQMRDRDGNLDGRQDRQSDTRRDFGSKDSGKGNVHSHVENGQTFTHNHRDGDVPHNHKTDDRNVKGYDRDELRSESGDRADFKGKQKPDVELSYGRDDDKRNPQGGHENIDKRDFRNNNVDMRGSEHLEGTGSERGQRREHDDVGMRSQGGSERDMRDSSFGQQNRDRHDVSGRDQDFDRKEVGGKDIGARDRNAMSNRGVQDKDLRYDHEGDLRQDQQDLKGRAGDRVSQQIDQKEQQLSKQGRSVTIESMEKDADDGRMGAIGGHSLRDGNKGGKQKKEARSNEPQVNPQTMKDGTKSRTDRPRT